MVRCELDQRCPMFAWHQIHEVAILRALTLADDGDPGGAYARLDDLARLDGAALDSADTFISVLVSLANLERTLDVATQLVITHSIGVRGSATRARADALATTLRSLKLGELGLDRVVVTEYLHLRHMLDQLDQLDIGASDGDTLELRGPRWLYSRARTQAELDRRFEARHAAALAGDTLGALGGYETTPTESVGWWLQNPVGDLLIESVLFDAEDLAASVDDRLLDVQGKHARLVDALAVD